MGGYRSPVMTERQDMRLRDPAVWPNTRWKWKGSLCFKRLFFSLHSMLLRGRPSLRKSRMSCRHGTATSCPTLAGTRNPLLTDKERQALCEPLEPGKWREGFISSPGDCEQRDTVQLSLSKVFGEGKDKVTESEPVQLPCPPPHGPGCTEGCLVLSTEETVTPRDWPGHRNRQ